MNIELAVEIGLTFFGFLSAGYAFMFRFVFNRVDYLSRNSATKKELENTTRMLSEQHERRLDHLAEERQRMHAENLSKLDYIQRRLDNLYGPLPMNQR